MNSTQNQEANHEEVEFRSSTTAFFFKSGFGWLLIVATILSFGALAIFTVPLGIYLALRFKTASYWLAGDRLFMRTGIIFRSEEEIELYRIKDVKADFSIIQQFFGDGNIVVRSSDATGIGEGRRTVLSIPYVADARGIREEIRNRVELARKHRGVRELDIG